EPSEAYRSVDDHHPPDRSDHQSCAVRVRGGQARTGESAELSALCSGRHHRVACGDRDQSRVIHRQRDWVRAGRDDRERAGHTGTQSRAAPAHDVLGHVHQSGPGLLQSDPDSTAGWQPRAQAAAAARRRHAVSPALFVRDHSHLARHVAASRRSGCLHVAGHQAADLHPAARLSAQVARRNSSVDAVVTSPITRDPGNGGFVVELEKFSGPLDPLLHLIREDEVDITDLPIAKIADQFLSVISELGLNQAADYLEMAARLLRIKAQMLLPRRIGDDEWEDPRAELVRRLLEYQQIRELVDWLARAAAARAERFGRGYEAPPPDAPPAPLQIDLNDLLGAAERVIALIPEPMLHRVVPRPLDVEGALLKIHALLAERDTFGWSDVVGPGATIVDVLSAFISLLELAKRSTVTLSQPEPFGPMVIKRATPREAA